MGGCVHHVVLTAVCTCARLFAWGVFSTVLSILLLGEMLGKGYVLHVREALEKSFLDMYGSKGEAGV